MTATIARKTTLLRTEPMRSCSSALPFVLETCAFTFIFGFVATPAPVCHL